ncbi:hypothetical protein ACN267_21000 [Micromonospora sp. WMMD734]|uniref:hypothetical protein n=1 Tax=Micromonospora sp. WMMD734 TaxID=3404129 RepID=UPI003B92E3A5
MQPQDMRRRSNRRGFTHRQQYGQRITHTRPEAGGNRNTERYALRAAQAYADPNDPAWAFGDQAGSHANLAIARVASGDLDAAAEALAPVLDLPADQRINGIIHSVRRVHQAITRAGHAGDARDLIDGIEHFTHTPANALPR